jgi:hypothetical protein
MIERRQGLRHALGSVTGMLLLLVSDAVVAAPGEQPASLPGHFEVGYRGSPPSFGPANTLKRRDAATVVARLAGFDIAAPRSNTFRDVLPSDAQFGAIEAMWREGVTAGCRAIRGMRSYCPDRPATRGQMAVFLSRAFAIPRQDSGQHFSDVPRTHPYHGFIEGLAQVGLAEPCPGQPGNYCPDAPATRADAATMLSRFLLAGVQRPPRAITVDATDHRARADTVSRSCPGPRGGTPPRWCSAGGP